MISATVLDAACLRGDVPADALIARLGQDAWAVSAVMRGVRRNDQRLPDALSPGARRYFAEEGLPPAWLDRTRVLRAQRWAQDHLLHVTAALFCASLPTAYAAERGARVLAATGRMDTDVERRVNETARFVLDVLAPGSLDPDGAGIRAVQKVRLVHATVRQSLVRHAPDTGGLPINQEDLLGTLLTFSVIVIGAVRRMGVSVNAREAEDFYHLWRGVGAMLGIEEGLLPAGCAEANDLARQIGDRQFRSSPHGRALMTALLARLEAHVPTLPGAPRLLVRHLVGDRVADLLGVPVDARFRALMLRLGPIPALARRAAQTVLLHATPLLARPLLETIVAAKLGGGGSGLERLRAPSPAAVR